MRGRSGRPGPAHSQAIAFYPRLRVRTRRKLASGTFSDELNLIKMLGQEGNHSGGLHRAVHEGLPSASDVTWPVSKGGILPSLVQGYSYTGRKKGGLETGLNACAG